MVKLTFVQGIARYQKDAYGVPMFLHKNGNSIDLVASQDPTIIVFAHYDGAYVVDELQSVSNAWGPFTGGPTAYLFWDINLLTAAFTRGFTLLPPIYSNIEPGSPSTDQHWFDTVHKVMRVWNGRKWIEVVRVFAGAFVNQATITAQPLGSQAGITGDFEGGSIVLDSFNKPLRQSDGTFVTSASTLTIINASSVKVKFETELLVGMASESIPKYSLVSQVFGRKLELARSSVNSTRITGIVLNDLDTNEVGNVVSEGLVQNLLWNWSADDVNKPFFTNNSGEITLTPPVTGVSQVAGYVYDKDSIFLDIQEPVILDSVLVPPTIPGFPASTPIADFYGTPQTGQAPLTVNFTNASLNGATSFQWDFTNDGVVDSTLTNVSHTFSTPGVYTVRLRALNDYGADDEVKTGYITVSAAPTNGLFTNLRIALSAAMQATTGSTVPVIVSTTNSGGGTATSVLRTIIINDVHGVQVQTSGLPTGSASTHVNESTVITLPVISTLGAGQQVTVSFNIIAPNTSSTVTISGSVSSPETDSTIGDNSTSISVRVKP